MSKNNRKKEQNQSAKEITDIKIPISSIALIVASFLLGLYDMWLLYGSMGNLELGRGSEGDPDYLKCMGLSFLLATIANFTALTWGYANGHNLTKKTINKHSIGGFLGWVFVGLIYVLIKIYPLIWPESSYEEGNIEAILLDCILLAPSYIGTGFLISAQMKRITNRKCVDARKFKRRFESIHEDTANEEAELNRRKDILLNYDDYYSNLKKQGTDVFEKIKSAEKAFMISKLNEYCPGLSPKTVNETVSEYLEKRKDYEKEIV